MAPATSSAAAKPVGKRVQQSAMKQTAAKAKAQSKDKAAAKAAPKKTAAKANAKGKRSALSAKDLQGLEDMSVKDKMEFLKSKACVAV